MSTTVTYEHEGRVARVAFDNSARGNSFDTPLLRELAEALTDAAADPSRAVIRLDMAGRHFCGGWDTASFAGLSEATETEVAERLREADALVERIRALPVPVVAGVRGQIIGFGVGLLSALHLPVAAADARASLPEARFGFAPAGVGHVVARTLPRATAYRLLSGIDSASGHDLREWGLVARVVDAGGDLDAAVDETVEALLTVPSATLRAVVDVVESSRATGSPDRAYAAAARTIVAATRAGSAS